MPTTRAFVTALLTPPKPPGLNGVPYVKSTAPLESDYGTRLADAPADGKLYARQSGGWAAEPVQSDAPADSRSYVRLNNTWSLLSGAAGVPEAPQDGATYGRNNAAWTAVLPLSGGNLTGALVLAADPAVALGAATRQYVDGKVVAPSATVPAMDGVAVVGVAVTYARADHVHPSDTAKANLASPALTGTPTAPTPATADQSTALATTAFVKNQGYATSAAVAGTYAPLASPVFTGDPRAPTPAVNDNDTSIATTAFVTAADNAVKAALIGSASTGMDTLGEIENYILANVNPAIGNKADIFSPTFTGDPKAPTPLTADNDTSIATTAFVKAQGYATVASLPVASGTNPVMDGAADPGVAAAYARGDHVHPTDTSRAPLVSPGFTGTPTAPTAAPATSTTQIATTAFVTAAVSGSVAGVTSWNTRSGAVTLTLADVVGAGGAPLNSPAFTGTALAPTPLTADNSTAIATTAFVKAQGYATTAYADAVNLDCGAY